MTAPRSSDAEREDSVVYVYRSGGDLPEVVYASAASTDVLAMADASAALARDVTRALQHLGIEAWQSITVEGDAGSVAIATDERTSNVSVASASAGTALGLVHRQAVRAIRERL